MASLHCESHLTRLITSPPARPALLLQPRPSVLDIISNLLKFEMIVIVLGGGGTTTGATSAGEAGRIERVASPNLLGCYSSIYAVLGVGDYFAI